MDICKWLTLLGVLSTLIVTIIILKKQNDCCKEKFVDSDCDFNACVNECVNYGKMPEKCCQRMCTLN